MVISICGSYSGRFLIRALRMILNLNQRSGLPFRSIDTDEQLRTDRRDQNDSLAGG
jgi:hypothetical protein